MALIPDIVVRRPDESEYGEHYQKWRVERAEKFEVWQPENVRFEHDPKWNERFMSIQAARSWYNPLKQPIWFIIGTLMFGSWIWWDLTYILMLRAR